MLTPAIRVFVIAIFACTAVLAQQPRIDEVSPAQGPIAAVSTISVRGANFSGATVRIDGVPVVPLTQSESVVHLRMEPHDNGFVVITIENVVGTAYGEFLYVPPRLQDLPPGAITTVAGVGNYVRTFGPAALASVHPGALAYDDVGNLYVSEAGQHRVTRVDPYGNIHEFASGNFYTDNPVADNVPAIGGGVAFPFGVAIGPGGNVYIGTHSPLLRKVDVRTGVISNVAGNNHVGFGGDGGPAREALIGQATALASDGTNVYFIDWDNTRIRRIDGNGIITTYAGNGTVGYSGDGGPATSASFQFGTSDDGNLALDPQGNLFVSDYANGAIRRIDRTTGIITTFYTPGSASDRVNGVRTLTFDREGNLYYGGAGRIVKVNAQGQFVTAWGPGGYVFIEDGPIAPATVRMGLVRSLAIDGSGNIVFSDDFFFRVRRINVSTNRLETIAGIYPAYQNENGPAVAAPLMNDNMDLAIGPDGNLVIGDFRLRRLDRDGNLQTIAGAHPIANIVDNVPADNMVNACLGIDPTSDGGFDLANTGSISHLDGAGIVRRLGGADAKCAFDGDEGPFKLAHLCQPWDSARDAAGNIYIADTNNNRIRRVDAVTGIITTAAGNGGPVNGLERYGQGTFCGDGGPAAEACVNTPYGVAVGNDGSVYFSENWTRVRRIAPNGTISTFSSTRGLTKLVAGPGGYLYGVNMLYAGRIDGNGTFAALAGSGQTGFSGDGGAALQARISSGSQASGVAVDAEGNFYFQDSNNRRIRAVRFGAVLAPANATITAAREGTTIRVTVRDASGRPAPSVRVEFTAPSSGATCRLSSSFAVTGNDGTASVTCTANCVPGSYDVKAQTLNAAAITKVAFANAAEPCRRRAVSH